MLYLEIKTKLISVSSLLLTTASPRPRLLAENPLLPPGVTMPALACIYREQALGFAHNTSSEIGDYGFWQERIEEKEMYGPIQYMQLRHCVVMVFRKITGNNKNELWLFSCQWEDICRWTILFNWELHSSILNPHKVNEEQVTNNRVLFFHLGNPLSFKFHFMDFLQQCCFAKQNLMHLLQPREWAARWKVDWKEKHTFIVIFQVISNIQEPNLPCPPNWLFYPR